MNLRKWQRLKERVEQLQKDKERSKGVLDQLMSQLSKDFDCNSVEGAKRLLRKLKRGKANGEEELKEALKKFEEDLKESEAPETEESEGED